MPKTEWAFFLLMMFTSAFSARSAVNGFPAQGLPKTKTQAIDPGPPRVCVRPMSAFFTWRFPLRPRSWLNTSATIRTPVAPTGCPQDFNPPLVFTGSSPFKAVTPSELSLPPSPRGPPSCSSSRATRARPRGPADAARCGTPSRKSGSGSASCRSIASSRYSHGRAFPNAATR